MTARTMLSSRITIAVCIVLVGLATLASGSAGAAGPDLAERPNLGSDSVAIADAQNGTVQPPRGAQLG